jgi:hypothetical protein
LAVRPADDSTLVVAFPVIILNLELADIAEAGGLVNSCSD